jgi:hypothetical protein
MRPIAHPTKYSITTLTLDDIAAVAAGPVRYSPPSPCCCNRLPTKRRLYLAY